MASEGVKLDIVLTDDGQPAQRPAGVGSPVAPTSGGSVSAGGPGQQSAADPLLLIADDVAAIRAIMEGQGGGQGGKKEEDKPEPQWLGRLRKGAEMFEASAKRMESLSVPLAGNDMMGTFKAATDGAAAGLSMLGSVGTAAGVALQSVSSAVESFGAVVNAFVERGRQLAQYSPELAVSQAKSEMTSLFADMREAEELGPGLSRITDAQTELMEILRETLLPIKKFIVSLLAPAMEFIVEQAKNGYIVINDIASIAKAIPEILYDLVTFNDMALATVVDRISTEMSLTRQEARKLGAKDNEAFNFTVGRILDELARRADAPLDGGVP
jgi:hypothetical protein